jgi:hypothetical protein
MKHNVPLKLGHQTIRVNELTKPYEENIYNEVSVIKAKELSRISHKHPHLATQGHPLVGEAAANWVADEYAAPGVGPELAVLVPVVGVAQIGVVFFHEADHPVVAEADLLELVLGEVIGLVLALAVLMEAVEAGLGELLALPPRPLLHSPAEIRVSLDAARRRPSALLLLLAAPRHAKDTILAVESGDSWVWEGEFGEEEADLLELVLGEVVGLVLALAVLVEAVEAGLGELLALPPCPLLHSPATVPVDGESGCRWRESRGGGRMGLGENEIATPAPVLICVLK